MDEQKIYIAEDNTATFVCSKCGSSKKKDVSQLKNMHKALRVKYKCVCGHAFSALLERRKFFRKVVNLTGGFVYGENKSTTPMTVINISRTGLNIKLKDMQGVSNGDTLFVEFHLDDKDKTLIREKVKVVSIIDGLLNVEFISVESGSLYDTAIRFYMLSP